MGISDYFSNMSYGYFPKMGDPRDFPRFNGNSTNKTQFWHARKFRDSTSVMKGGMCEDVGSGYFAGAFMGRKFKNPATQEFERSLEYLLDDLSSTTSMTPSIGSTSSCTSLDTIIDRGTTYTSDSNSSARDGFMINVTIRDKKRMRNKQRPCSDIFDFVQGSDTNHSSYKGHLPISKTQSLMDVSQPKQKHKPSAQAKEYEREFESMLDDLHSTLKELDQFSREKIGVSLDSLTSVDSVSSISNSDQVSSFSHTPETSCENTHSPEDINLPLGEGFKYTKLEEEDDDIAGNNKCNHKNEVIAYIRPSVNDNGSELHDNILRNSSFRDEAAKPSLGINRAASFHNLPEKYPQSNLTNTKTELQNVHRKSQDLPPTNSSVKVNSNVKQQFVKDTGKKEFNPYNVYKAGNYPPNKVLQDVTQFQDMEAKKFVVKKQDSLTDSMSKTTEGESIMSSVTDLSVTGSEIGYIADMEESVINETPNVPNPWLDTNVQINPESGMGDCFVQQGFRPLNFVGVESKYMITPKKGVELRIPTPVKLRKSISTQTVESIDELNATDSTSGNESNKQQRVLVCASTQTELQDKCICGSNISFTSDTNKSQEDYLNVWAQSEKRKRRVSYNSSVEISPLLNGSQLINNTKLQRANSVDSVLAKNNSKMLSKSGNYSDSQVKEFLSNKNSSTKGNKTDLESSVDRIPVPKPKIVVSVHSLEADKQCLQSTKDNECKFPTHTPRNLFVTGQKKRNLLKSESAPNISKSFPKGQTDMQCDNKLRRYASILIISNIGKHLQACCTKKMKRSSYEQDVNLATEREHSLTRELPLLNGVGISDAKLSNKKSNRRKKIITYTF